MESQVSQVKQFQVIKLINILDEDFSFKWNNESYPVIKAGSETSLPAFLAEHVVKKIVDRAMIKDNKMKVLNDKRIRQEYIDRVLVSEPEVVEEEPEVRSLEDMTMAEVRSEARERGVAFKMTDKKVDLIARLNGQD